MQSTVNSRDNTPHSLDKLENMGNNLERKLESVEALGVAVSEPFVKEDQTLTPILTDIRKKVNLAFAYFHHQTLVQLCICACFHPLVHLDKTIITTHQSSYNPCSNECNEVSRLGLMPPIVLVVLNLELALSLSYLIFGFVCHYGITCSASMHNYAKFTHIHSSTQVIFHSSP